jgi:hypothetical protein
LHCLTLQKFLLIPNKEIHLIEAVAESLLGHCPENASLISQEQSIAGEEKSRHLFE